MHARHRSPGNGYRSSTMGMGGVGGASRISPEGSIRGHGMYQSEYRGYNRGFGRGHPKSYQPPQPPQLPAPRRGDVFIEAGRLAAEYLVSKGLLPPNVLSGKWQNGGLKSHLGDFQGFRGHGENLQFPPESRIPALSRLGNAAADAGSGRRRFPDQYSDTGTRNNTRGRKRTESFKNYGTELNRDLGRSGSWSDKARDSPDLDGEDSAFSGYQEEQQVAKDDVNELQKSPAKVAPKSEVACDTEANLEKYCLDDYAGLKATSIIAPELAADAELEPSDKSGDTNVSHFETGEVKDGSCKDELKKQSAADDIGTEHSSEDDPASKSGYDLLKHCKFAKVPTRTRSSLTVRNMKNDPIRNAADGNCQEIGLPRGPGVPIEEVCAVDPKADPRSQNQRSQFIDSEISEALPGENAGEVGLKNAAGHEFCMESGSFPERPFLIEQESSETPAGFGRAVSVITGRGEKRALEENYGDEGSKRAREWVSSVDSPDDDYLPISKLREKFQASLEGKTPPDEQNILGADQKRSMDLAMFSKRAVEPSLGYAEEKQLFPGSFKICDLNLMESSDVNETHDADPVLIFPSVTESKKASVPVDIDLSMNNNCNMSTNYARIGANGKEVEVIDLENDSTLEDRSFSCSEKKEDNGLTDLESFPNRAQNANDINDGQDGYGLMISELLGADIPNCSSVPSDINSLHNDMGLHNGEEILGDDDSIYMSLGEIPISFSRVWEQPTQEFEKPF